MTERASAINKLLVEVLTEEVSGFKEFRRLLLSEQEALMTANTEAISETTETKDVRYQKLNRLASDRAKLISSLGFAATKQGVFSWVNQSPEDVVALWNVLLDLAKEVQRLNDVNGKLIHTRLQYTQQTLSALLTAVNQANLYGSNGQPNSVPTSGNTRGIIGKA